MIDIICDNDGDVVSVVSDKSCANVSYTINDAGESILKIWGHMDQHHDVTLCIDFDGCTTRKLITGRNFVLTSEEASK